MLKIEVQRKLAALPGLERMQIEFVLDPPLGHVTDDRRGKAPTGVDVSPLEMDQHRLLVKPSQE